MTRDLSSAAPGSMADDTSFFGHPRGLSTLFFTELWERFSFYGMRALLILFMTAAPAHGGLGFTVRDAGAVYGLYTASVYMLSLPGGWIADRFIGQRKAVLYGGILIACGHFSMAVPALATFYAGLVLIAAGTGLLKPNVSMIVGQLYEPEDHRRDSAFSIFYMGINIGAFVAPLACGWVGQRISWHIGFGLAGIGMVFGLIQYVTGWRYLGSAGLQPAAGSHEKIALRRQLYIGLAGIMAVVFALWILAATGAVEMTPAWISNAFGIALLAVSVVTFTAVFAAGHWTRKERNRLLVVLALFIGATLFWAVYEQKGSTISLFAASSVDNRIFGFDVPASWYQSLTALFVILLAPLFAWLWIKLGRRDPSSPAKFAIGLFFASLAFFVWMYAARVAEGGEKVSPLWLVTMFFLLVVGEMCLSPVGLSAMTRLVPARVGGFIMGVWFLAASLGNFLGGRAASSSESISLPALAAVVAAIALAAAVLMSALIRPMRGMEE